MRKKKYRRVVDTMKKKKEIIIESENDWKINVKCMHSMNQKLYMYVFKSKRIFFCIFFVHCFFSFQTIFILHSSNDETHFFFCIFTKWYDLKGSSSKSFNHIMVDSFSFSFANFSSSTFFFLCTLNDSKKQPFQVMKWKEIEGNETFFFSRVFVSFFLHLMLLCTQLSRHCVRWCSCYDWQNDCCPRKIKDISCIKLYRLSKCHHMHTHTHTHLKTSYNNISRTCNIMRGLNQQETLSANFIM